MPGVYIHIPYCRTKCPYCDFVSIPTSDHVPSQYIAALKEEIRGHEAGAAVTSVFFGGGTPSLLLPGHVATLLEQLAGQFRLSDPEITLEANADDITPELVRQWKEIGVNRLSVGVQSFCDETLQYLGRRHDADTARRACGVIAERFDNWSMDLIFGAPPLSKWMHTLKECQCLAPPHVSVYGLTYEEGTPFEARRGDTVDDSEWLDLYWKSDQILAHANRYEISNFAVNGYECRHNLIYWHNEDYLGFGAAAYSFLGNVRSRNTVSVADYMSSPFGKSEFLPLDAQEVRLETVIQHFRLREGLSRSGYRARFAEDVELRFGTALAELSADGLLNLDGDFYRPTQRGFEMNNEIGLALIDLPRGQE